MVANDVCPVSTPALLATAPALPVLAFVDQQGQKSNGVYTQLHAQIEFDQNTSTALCQCQPQYGHTPADANSEGVCSGCAPGNLPPSNVRPRDVPSPVTPDEEYPNPPSCANSGFSGDKADAWEGQCVGICPGDQRSDPDAKGNRRLQQCFHDPVFGLCNDTTGTCDCWQGKITTTGLSIPVAWNDINIPATGISGSKRQFVFCPTSGDDACRNLILIADDTGSTVPRDGYSVEISNLPSECQGVQDPKNSPTSCFSRPTMCPGLIAKDPDVGNSSDYFSSPDTVKNFGKARPPLAERTTPDGSQLEGQSCFGKGLCTWCSECLCDPGSANYEWYKSYKAPSGTSPVGPPFPLLANAPDPFCRRCASSRALPGGSGFDAPDGYALHLSWLYDRPGENQGEGPISDIAQATMPPGVEYEGTWDIGPCLPCVFLKTGEVNNTCPSACDVYPTTFSDCNASARESGQTAYNVCMHTGLFEPRMIPAPGGEGSQPFVVGVSSTEAIHASNVQTAPSPPGQSTPGLINGRVPEGLSIGMHKQPDGNNLLGCRCGADFVQPGITFGDNLDCSVYDNDNVTPKKVVSCCVAQTLDYTNWIAGSTAEEIFLTIPPTSDDPKLMLPSGRTIAVPTNIRSATPDVKAVVSPAKSPSAVVTAVDYYQVWQAQNKMLTENVLGRGHCGAWGIRTKDKRAHLTVSRLQQCKTNAGQLGTAWQKFAKDGSDCGDDKAAAEHWMRDPSWTAPAGFWEQQLSAEIRGGDGNAYGCALWKLDGTAVTSLCSDSDDVKWQAMLD